MFEKFGEDLRRIDRDVRERLAPGSRLARYYVLVRSLGAAERTQGLHNSNETESPRT